MFSLIKNIILFLFFGVVPLVLISFLIFAGIKIYTNQPNNITVATIEPKISIKPKESLETKNLNITSGFNLNESIQNNEQQNAETKVTLPDQVLLKIPLIYQKYNLNCEATSLAMALQYRGINVSQEEVLTKIGYTEPIKKQWKDGKIIWGDPDKGFVGNEKGFVFTSSAGLAGGNGWGVNNGPVADAADTYRPGSKEIDGATLEDLKQALAQDKPVIFWHKRDDARQQILTYSTPEGKEVKQFQNHVNLLIGYKTDKKGNVSYTFNDPIYGVINYSEKDLIRIWGKYNNEIVIVN